MSSGTFKPSSLIGVVLAMLALAGLSSNSTASPLVVTPEALDAGEAAPGETVLRSFDIENTGSEAVAFEFTGLGESGSAGSDFELAFSAESFGAQEFRLASDGPLSGDWTGFAGALDLISATGGTWTNDLTILLTSAPEQEPATVFYQIGGNAIASVPANHLFPWPSGNGAEPIDERVEFIEPIEVDGLFAWVGNAWNGGEGTWDGTVTLMGLGSQTGLITTVSPSSGELAAGESVTVEAVFDPGARVPGIYEESLVLSTDHPDQAELAIPVRLSVLAQATLAPLPDALDFGEVVVGLTASETLSIENTGNVALLVEDISVNGDGFSISAAELNIAPFSSAELTVEYAPDAAGADSGVLTFTTSDSDAPQGTVDLSGSGIAAPAIGIEPAALDVSLAAGDEASVSFDIVNSGDGPLDFVLPAFADQPSTSVRASRPDGVVGALAERGAQRSERREEDDGVHPDWQGSAATTDQSASATPSTSMVSAPRPEAMN